MSCGSANEMDIDYLNEFFFGLHKSLLGFVIIIAVKAITRGIEAKENMKLKKQINSSAK